MFALEEKYLFRGMNDEKHIVYFKKYGDIIEGDKRGTYVECSCKTIAIDETKWYTRLIGNPKDYEEIKKKK